MPFDEVYEPEQVNLGDATNNPSPPDTRVGFTMDGLSGVSQGMGGAGDTDSLNQLGSTITWNSQTFELGPAYATNSVPNAIAGSSNTIASRDRPVVR